MSALTNRLNLRAIPWGRAVAILTLACLGIKGLPFLLAGWLLSYFTFLLCTRCTQC